jgi:hypothetical protein
MEIDHVHDLGFEQSKVIVIYATAKRARGERAAVDAVKVN